MSFIPPPPERIAGELIELRPIAEWDIPEVLIAHQDDRELHRWLGLAKPPSGAEMGREVEQAESQRSAGTAIKLTIVEPGSNDCIGRVEVGGFDWELASADVRVWVSPQLRGRGYEQRAAELAREWLCSTVGLRELNVSLRGAPTT
jgi:RimJ/RimL family protein N-acetyltransferase